MGGGTGAKGQMGCWGGVGGGKVSGKGRDRTVRLGGGKCCPPLHPAVVELGVLRHSETSSSQTQTAVIMKEHCSEKQNRFSVRFPTAWVKGHCSKQNNYVGRECDAIPRGLIARQSKAKQSKANIRKQTNPLRSALDSWFCSNSQVLQPRGKHDHRAPSGVEADPLQCIVRDSTCPRKYLQELSLVSQMWREGLC